MPIFFVSVVLPVFLRRCIQLPSHEARRSRIPIIELQAICLIVVLILSFRRKPNIRRHDSVFGPSSLNQPGIGIC